MGSWQDRAVTALGCDVHGGGAGRKRWDGEVKRDVSDSSGEQLRCKGRSSILWCRVLGTLVYTSCTVLSEVVTDDDSRIHACQLLAVRCACCCWCLVLQLYQAAGFEIQASTPQPLRVQQVLLCFCFVLLRAAKRSSRVAA